MTDYPEITEDMLREADEILRNAKPTPIGKRMTCGTCGKRTLIGCRDLVVREPTPAGVITIVNLSGGRCTTCGEHEYDAAAIYQIAEATERQGLIADYETTVTTVGKMPATYLKADLARVMGLRPGQRLLWTPLDRDRALVRVDRGE